ncbi:MAG TPA: zf-HC2 domain-containing protein [Terriglobales bacterium]
MNNDLMNHEQAVSNQAAERYLLAELSQEEREAFEGHYFDCPACFEQVKLGMDFLHHTRDVLDPEPEKGWLARALGDLLRPVPAFASVALVLAAGIGVYQQSIIASLKAPRLESSYVVTGQAKGGASAKVVSVSRKAGLSLKVEFLRKPEFASYQAQIVTASGSVKATVLVPAGVSDDSLTIALPADTLDAGAYSVVVYGVSADGSKTQAGGGAFDLQFVE